MPHSNQLAEHDPVFITDGAYVTQVGTIVSLHQMFNTAVVELRGSTGPEGLVDVDLSHLVKADPADTIGGCT